MANMTDSGWDSGGIRILHVVETLDVGGAEAVVANIVNNMSAAFRADICCLMHSGPIAGRVGPAVDIIEMGKATAGNDYTLPLRLAKLLRSRRIDIVQSHDWGTFLETAVAATLAGTRMIHMAHGPTAHYPTTDRLRILKGVVRRRLERLAGQKLSRAIAVSEVVKRELVEQAGIPSRKVTLVRNGIDLTARPPVDIAGKRAEAGLTVGDFVLLTVGRLAEIKNYPLLLEALAIAVKQVPSIKLLMVGDGVERARLEATAARLGLNGHVRFLGERNDVRDWLVLGDAFVLSSHYEGISLALLEAMAAGLPAVVTRVGGNPEAVTHGENGLLVAPGDVNGLAQALIAMASDAETRRAMGRAARFRVERDFNLKIVVERFEKMYLECLRSVVD